MYSTSSVLLGTQQDDAQDAQQGDTHANEYPLILRVLGSRLQRPCVGVHEEGALCAWVCCICPSNCIEEQPHQLSLGHVPYGEQVWWVVWGEVQERSEPVLRRDHHTGAADHNWVPLDLEHVAILLD